MVVTSGKLGCHREHETGGGQGRRDAAEQGTCVAVALGGGKGKGRSWILSVVPRSTPAGHAQANESSQLGEETEFKKNTTSAQGLI